MGSMVVSVRLCILSLSMLILTSSYAPHQVHALLSVQQAQEAHLLSPLNSPRKLRLFEQVTIKGRDDEVSTAAQRQKEDRSGGVGVHGSEPSTMHGKDKRGTWREWAEGTDPTQYFTMDYSNVRRRRPIHNKSLPVGP
ncbi:uncharacterized protein LOC115666024 isoform X2 [Syzygium oleosum]|uniref:uncharacterized protein LOC115666024 isoform X2 n=1 Tax=Syzygium oleosum TaxID=219896 RepID=UPI0024BBBB14|nr:uncharacterized protein LOC115666024 isoform X2 [Syzygium oleosum]